MIKKEKLLACLFLAILNCIVVTAVEFGPQNLFQQQKNYDIKEKTSKTGKTYYIPYTFDIYPQLNTKNKQVLEFELQKLETSIAHGTDKEGRLDCPRVFNPACDGNFWYRQPDGSCNNLNQTWWGASNTPYKRIKNPNFQDGTNSPRALGVDGKRLKSGREIANKVHFPSDLYKDITHLLPIFGQFVIHDVVRTVHTLGPDGDVKKCVCGSTSPDCISIPIPKDDYRFKNQECLIMVREADARETFDCDLESRTQLNLINSWLDNSNIYGNTKEEEAQLRAFYGGRLEVSYFKGAAGPLLPSKCPFNAFYLLKKRDVCFISGDDRVNQYPTLTAMHTLWVREHNRVAGELWKINPHWDDERLFQEAKRIVNGIYQNIVYWEWLPLIIGNDLIGIFDLQPQKDDRYFTGYDESIFPNVAVEFAVAAARFGHTLFRPTISKANNYYNVIANYTLRDVMFSPEMVIPDKSLDEILLGTVTDMCEQHSPHVNAELHDWLIQDLGNDNPAYWFSLPAINIERGRETGLPGYAFYREKAGLNFPYSFDDLSWISPKNIQRLKTVYKNVLDIDLFTGGLSEAHVEGGIVGPTFAYIIARGFRDWKYADRWFYENPQGITPLAFTKEQLNSLRKMKLNSLFCNNLDVKEVPYNIFLRPDPDTNPFIPCKKVWQLDLKSFKDNVKSEDIDKNIAYAYADKNPLSQPPYDGSDYKKPTD